MFAYGVGRDGHVSRMATFLLYLVLGVVGLALVSGAAILLMYLTSLALVALGLPFAAVVDNWRARTRRFRP